MKTKYTISVREVASKMDRGKHRGNILHILDLIDISLKNLIKDIDGPQVVPSFHAHVDSKGDFDIGWNTKDIRVIISIPSDLSDAYWVLVSSKELGNIMAEGKFPWGTTLFPSVFAWLFYLISEGYKKYIR